MKKIIWVACCALAFASDYDDGVGAYQNRDFKAAFEIWQKACNTANDAASCNGLGVLYKNGQGVTQNATKGRDYIQKACDKGNAGGCYTLGQTYKNADGVEKDIAKAAEYYTKACDDKYALGCYSLATAYRYGNGVKKDKDKALGYYSKACVLNDQMSCKEHDRLREYIERE